MIEAKELTKTFGGVKAVQGVSFTVKAGEAVGFLGPNGAGKTTTFRMLAGIIGPTSGSVRLLDHDLATDPLRAKRALGYMPENAPLYPEMTAEEYLLYRAELKGVPRRKRRAEVTRVAESTNTKPILGTRISHLSKGYRQRVALADALLGDPSILLLDEPTSGLDPNQVLDMRRLIAELAKDHAILLSTHVLSEVAATCSRAVVIHKGRIVAEGSLSELQKAPSERRARLLVEGSLEVVRRILGDALVSEQLAGEKPPRSEGTASFLVDLKGSPLAEVLQRLVQAHILVHEATPLRPALDDVFAELTQPKTTPLGPSADSAASHGEDE